MKIFNQLPVIPVLLFGLSFCSFAAAQSDSKSGAGENKLSKNRPVPVNDGVAKLNPQNSKIEFVGTHVGDDPKPRLGGFKEFDGQIRLAADNSIESLALNINVDSVWTEFDKLTIHLKNADFFETDKFGTAKFVSTRIEANGNQMSIFGDLTMHGVTQEISFPVKGKLDQSGVIMVSEFSLDRTRFGMDKMTSGVEKTVSIKFVVGEATTASKSMPGPGTERKTSSKNSEADIQQITLYAPNMT